jgi:hypothetical protein
MFMAIVLFRPEGIVGAWRALLAKRPLLVAGERLNILNLLRR